MPELQMRFDDGAAYERMMGVWTQIAGRTFLDWLAPAAGQRWLDVGCGNGAFTELLLARCAPSAVEGIDPSEAQLAFARTRPAGKVARFNRGDAMALPYEADSFDASVMALVIFFVPEPARGVAEMVRVTRAGGSVSAYAWDVEGGGLPFAPVHNALRKMGFKPPLPPSLEASRLESLRSLWADAGLVDIETREIVASRTYVDFEDFWAINVLSTSIRPMVASMSSEEVNRLRTEVRASVSPDASGRIDCSARANAVKGRVS